WRAGASSAAARPSAGSPPPPPATHPPRSRAPPARRRSPRGGQRAVVRACPLRRPRDAPILRTRESAGCVSQGGPRITEGQGRPSDTRTPRGRAARMLPNRPAPGRAARRVLLSALLPGHAGRLLRAHAPRPTRLLLPALDFRRERAGEGDQVQRRRRRRRRSHPGLDTLETDARLLVPGVRI